MQSIVTLTMNPTIDTSSSVEHVMSEQKLRCKPPRDEPGGGGINVSRAIKKLGGRSRSVYPVGGWYGLKLKEMLDREGLDHLPVPIEGATRQDLIILDEGSGQQYRFQMPGPRLSEAEWKRCCEALSGISPKPDYVVASGSLPPGVPDDFYARLGKIAAEFGARYILDTSGEPLLLGARAGVFMLKPNINELKKLAEQDIRDEAQLEEAARKIPRSGRSEIVVISLGAGGALMVSTDGMEHMRAPTVPIRSKVGAGDSMVAGIVLKLAQGEPIREAVRFGIAAGTAAVMTPGTELCRRDDAERLYQRMLSGSFA